MSVARWPSDERSKQMPLRSEASFWRVNSGGYMYNTGLLLLSFLGNDLYAIPRQFESLHPGRET